MRWSEARADENNKMKSTKVAPLPPHEEQEQEQSTTAVVALRDGNEGTTTSFDKLSWEVETAAIKSLTHQDTRTAHHSFLIEHHDHRHLNEKIQQARRDLLQVALESLTEKSNEDEDTLELRRLWNSATLTTLDLNNTSLGERGFVALLATLQMLPHIASLKIPNSALISPFIVALAVVCRPRFLPRLQHLDLDGNPGGSMCVEALCELVRSHPLLTEVVIDRGFECLPSSRKRLQRSLDENRKRNAARRETCTQRLQQEEKLERERRAKIERDRLENLHKNLSVLEDIESRSRYNISSLESSEFSSDIDNSFQREKLSLEMYLTQRAESEQQRIELEKKDKLWKESQEAERSSVETRENGRRRGIDSDYDSVIRELNRDEQMRRTNILRNAEARAQVGIELERDAQKRKELSEKVEASQIEYKRAFEERLDVDRHLALARKHYLEKAAIDAVTADEPAGRRALEKTEASTRDFMISGFIREKLDRERRQDQRVEIERQAAESLMKRQVALAHEAEIRRRDEEEGQRKAEEEMRQQSLRKQLQRQQEEEKKNRKDQEEQKKMKQQQHDDEEQERKSKPAQEAQQEERLTEEQESIQRIDEQQQQPKQEDETATEHSRSEQQQQHFTNADADILLDEEIQRKEIHQMESQKYGGMRLLLKLESSQTKWKKDEEETKSSSDEEEKNGIDEQQQPEQEQEQEEAMEIAAKNPVDTFNSQFEVVIAGEQTQRALTSSEENETRTSTEIKIKLAVEKQIEKEVNEKETEKELQEQQKTRQLEQEAAEEKAIEQQQEQSGSEEQEHEHSPLPVHPSVPSEQVQQQTHQEDEPSPKKNKSKSKSSSSELSTPQEADDHHQPSATIQQQQDKDDDDDDNEHHEKQPRFQPDTSAVIPVVETKQEDKEQEDISETAKALEKEQKQQPQSQQQQQPPAVSVAPTTTTHDDENAPPKKDMSKSRSKSNSTEGAGAKAGDDDFEASSSSGGSLNTDALREASTSSTAASDESEL